MPMLVIYLCYESQRSLWVDCKDSISNVVSTAHTDHNGVDEPVSSLHARVGGMQ